MAMGLEDYFDSYAFDEDNDDLPNRRATCKFCGKTDLYWEMYDNKWKLVDAKYRVHNCLGKKVDLNAVLNKPIKEN